ncbi:MAG: HAMP domain-containing protein [archaeon]
MREIYFGLSARIVGIVFIISVIFFSIFTVYSINKERELLDRSYVVKAEALVFALDAGLGTKKDLEDKSEILSTIHKHIWLDPDILAISVNTFEDGELKVFASNDELILNQLSNEINKESFDSNSVINKIIETEHERILRISSPIHIAGQSLGTYQIDMTLEEADKKIVEATEDLVVANSIVTILFVFFIFLFLRLIVINPIEKLTQGVNEFAKGDWDFKVEKSSKDEIGELTDSFNKMAGDLKESHSALKKHEKELEIIVEKRTKELSKKVAQLEKFSKFSVGRENRMVELKKKIAELEKKLGKSEKK